ncbi:hypothetical protein [Listeria booriae]|uniref:hypothetical protein n=1 Tax=Listeria booriae TaxID=1552123 RepID=UPI001624B726|nr:hypothetical protein [Listeria booriae]MBC2149518.1 hypothetical protein [Listeria booriae]
MIKISRKQAGKLEVIKKYATENSRFSFTELGMAWERSRGDWTDFDGRESEAIRTLGTFEETETAKLERAYYEGYEIEPDWKFDIGDIVQLAPTLATPRSLWYVKNRIDVRGKAHYTLCGNYNSHAQAYREAGGPPYTEVAEEKLTLIKKKSEWVKALSPNPPMHPRCGHGSKAQY